MNDRLQTAANGRDTHGRFTLGNPGGPGSPHVGKVAKLRAALFATVSAKDLRKIIRGLVKAAVEGDIAAAKMILQWTLGEPLAWDVLARIETLEAAMQAGTK
jgi:hypothetical protein